MSNEFDSSAGPQVAFDPIGPFSTSGHMPPMLVRKDGSPRPGQDTLDERWASVARCFDATICDSGLSERTTGGEWSSKLENGGSWRRAYGRIPNWSTLATGSGEPRSFPGSAALSTCGSVGRVTYPTVERLPGRRLGAARQAWRRRSLGQPADSEPRSKTRNRCRQ